MIEDNAPPPAPHQEPDGWQWIIFTDASKACLTYGENISKAVSNWRKGKKGRGEPVGIIKCGYSDNLPFALRGTDVFGVVCCVHRPEGAAAPGKGTA
jgi:hypothetical protein